MSEFHFAWVNPGETTFIAGTHAREDESVFAMKLSQVEGEFASAIVTVRKPAQGLLNPARKIHAWISVTHAAVTTALLFGRLVGFPRQIAGNTFDLEFVAQFPGWEAARDALVAANQALPFYDPAFLSAAEQRDPSSVLEGRTKLFHYHRTTGAVILSDILTSATTITLEPLPGEALRVDITGSPARRVNVYATVEWEQRIRGSTNRPNREIRNAFGMIPVNTLTPEAIEDFWPKVGDNLGGETGYVVGRARIVRIGATALPSNLPGESDEFYVGLDDEEVAIVEASTGLPADRRLTSIERVWFDTDLRIDYLYRQSRVETIQFVVENDVQALAFGTDDQVDISIDLNAQDVVDEGLLPAYCSTYFRTARGLDSFKHLLARAKAALAQSTRAIEITVPVEFWDVLAISCNHQATVTSAQLPGGTATGKVIGYTFDVTAEAINAEVVVAVSVGNGDSYSASGLEFDYVDGDPVTGALTSHTQMTTGQDNGGTGLEDMIFDSYMDQGETVPAASRYAASGNIVRAVTVTNGPEDQQAELFDNQFPTNSDPAGALAQIPTMIEVDVFPLAGGDDLEHTITVNIPYPYAAPQGINLAA